MKQTFSLAVLLLIFSLSTVVLCDSKKKEKDIVYVIGNKKNSFLTPSAVQFVSQKELEEFSNSDIHKVLKRTKGVHVQEEDGYGLRPNIGLRGATAHRSKKITLLEDGILIGPAPYSAPAAYYFPTPFRIYELEVFKGVASTPYGPNSIGGAVNIITPPISTKPFTRFEVQYGLVKKYQAIHSQTLDSGWSYLLHLNRFESEGFKKLPSDQFVGFYRNNFSAKVAKQLTPQSKLQLNLSLSDEMSKETYLGLSESDFEQDPYQRYTASERDQLDWEHQQYQLHYTQKIDADNQFGFQFYRHQFLRKWDKVSRFARGGFLFDSIDPGHSSYDPHYLSVLRGESDSLENQSDLVFGYNHRYYTSQGAQAYYVKNSSFGEVHNTLNFKFRFHHDEIERRHKQQTLRMLNGQLTPRGSIQDSTHNTDYALATSLSLSDELSWKNLTLTGALRAEHINSVRETNNKDVEEQLVFAPGLGVSYFLYDSWNFIAGWNKGSSVLSPGQDSSVDPEESDNYEAGFKWSSQKSQAELIGFYSDYRNIKGTCTFSTGCPNDQLDKEYNGGKAEIYGVELEAKTTIPLKSYNLSFGVNYTWTQTQFLSSFTLGSSQREWGIDEIKKGDPLPYIPEHKAALHVGFEKTSWGVYLSSTWQDFIYDQSQDKNRKTLPSHHVHDLAAFYKPLKNMKIKAKVENVLDQDYAVSYRPLGLRPGKPLTMSLGLNYDF